MNRTLIYLQLVFITFFNQLTFSQDCEKCNLNILLEVSENIENLNSKLISDFVCTFDSTCVNNAEFSEWSNELLFKVVKNDINLLNKSLHELGYDYVLLIANELANPIIDVDYYSVYEIIQVAQGPKDIILAEKNAIIKAAEKEGIDLEE